jgi:hypothetical protein
MGRLCLANLYRTTLDTKTSLTACNLTPPQALLHARLPCGTNFTVGTILISLQQLSHAFLAAAGATSNPESKGVELFVLPSPGHRFLPTAFVQFYCSSSQLIVLVNTVRSSSCEYQSRRRARLACKIRFVPLAKHWYMLRPSLP